MPVGQQAFEYFPAPGFHPQPNEHEIGSDAQAPQFCEFSGPALQNFPNLNGLEAAADGAAGVRAQLARIPVDGGATLAAWLRDNDALMSVNFLLRTNKARAACLRLTIGGLQQFMFNANSAEVARNFRPSFNHIF